MNFRGLNSVHRESIHGKMHLKKILDPIKKHIHLKNMALLKGLDLNIPYSFMSNLLSEMSRCGGLRMKSGRRNSLPSVPRKTE